MEKTAIIFVIVIGVAYVLGDMLYYYIMERKEFAKCRRFKDLLEADKVRLYFNYKGAVCGYDSYGDEIRKQYFINEKGQKIDILTDVKKEILSLHFTDNSQVCQTCRVTVDKITLKQPSSRSAMVQVSLRPVDGDASVWTVVEDSVIVPESLHKNVRMLVLENPLLGTLSLPNSKVKGGAIKGQKISLISRVKKVGNLFHLEYEVVN